MPFVTFVLSVPKGFEFVVVDEICDWERNPTNINAPHLSGYVFHRVGYDDLSDLEYYMKKLASMQAVIQAHILVALRREDASWSQRDDERTLDEIMRWVRDDPTIYWNEGLLLWRRCMAANQDGSQFPPSGNTLRFRASFERNSFKHHSLRNQDFAGAIGAGLLEKSILDKRVPWFSQMDWEVSLKRFDLKILGFVFPSDAQDVTNSEFTYDIGLAITLPIHLLLGKTDNSLKFRNRCILGRTSLNPCIAYCLAKYADIQVGDIVLEPCCGAGTIPIEACVNFKKALYITGDMKLVADTNIQHVDCHAAIDLFHWDATMLHLRDGCIDKIITDLPWGRREGSHTKNAKFYPQFLKEAARVLKTGGKAILLTMEKRLMDRHLSENPLLSILSIHPVVVGYTVYVYDIIKR